MQFSAKKGQHADSQKKRAVRTGTTRCGLEVRVTPALIVRGDPKGAGDGGPGLTYWPTGSVVRCAPKAPTMCRTFGMLTSNRPVTAIGWSSTVGATLA